VIRVVLGPAIPGHVFRDWEEAVERALPVLVHHYAQATGRDVHPMEVSLVQVRGISRDGRLAKYVTTEVRLGLTVIAVWREEAL